jgi:hypothetical protein
MQPQSALRATRTKEDMFELIANHNKGATSVKEFCQLHGLTQGVFYYWQKKYHLENSEPGSQSGFVQLQVEDTPQAGAQQGLFAEVRGIKPKSAIGVAMAYSIKRWEKLSLYTPDGKLQIDNNCVERSVRPVSIGRKNFLFCGSHEAAKRTALLYSLLVTCKLNNVNQYLRSVHHRWDTSIVRSILQKTRTINIGLLPGTVM